MQLSVSAGRGMYVVIQLRVVDLVLLWIANCPSLRSGSERTEGTVRYGYH